MEPFESEGSSPDSPLDPPLDPIEERVEAYLEGLVAGSPPSLDALAAGLSPEQSARLRAEALAQECLMRQARGDSVSPAEFLARLESAEQRRLFQDIFAQQRAARQVLPGVLIPGLVLDERYEIRREIGEGGMGRVYAALDRELEREVALKVLRVPLDEAQRDEREQSFRRESRTLAKLESRNIVAIHDICRGSEHSYIVMDVVPGLDLRTVIERARAARSELGLDGTRSSEPLRRVIGRAKGAERAELLGERTHARCVARILRTAAQAMEAAHAAGVVHRDLKPQNVLVLAGGEPMLLDFGLASWRSEHEEAGFHGTPEYLAPEQIESQSSGQDPRTDVYQLGILLYELLTLERAFAPQPGDDLFLLFRRIREGSIRPAREFVPGLSPTLEAILARALARDPARRYPRAGELREDLDRFLARRPPKHAPLSALRTSGLWSLAVLRHPATWVAAALVFAGTQFLRSAPWVPPVRMEAFQYQGGALAALQNGQVMEVSADLCILGLEVLVEEPTWLYAFSVFVPEGESERRLSPVTPERLEDVIEPDFEARPDGPLRLEPGNHRVACAVLRRPNPNPKEGILALVCAREEPLLARLQETLRERERVTRVPAREGEVRLLEQDLSGRVRGESLAAMSREDHAIILGPALDEPPGNSGAPRGLEGIYSQDFVFDVRSGGH